jgi:hypothetical protein
MARISEQVLAGLARPTMAQGMFDLGAAIGGVPGQMKQKRRQEEFNEIMKMGQAAMTQNDPVNLSRVAQQLASLGYTKESQQFAQAAQQANLKMQQQERVSGLLTQAGSEEGLTREAVQSFVGAGGNLANIPIVRELEKQYDEPLREKGRGRLRAMAQMELFDPQDPGKLQGYKNVAERHKVSFNEAMQILAEERGTQIDRAKTAATTRGKPSYVDRGDILDSRNLRYGLSEIRTGPNPEDITLNYEPIGHEIPFVDTIDGKRNTTTPLGGAYRETAGGKTERVIEEAKAKTKLDITKAQTIKESDNFSDQRSAAAQRLPMVEETLTDVNDLLEIVEVIDQGGSLVPFMNNINRILGYEEKNPGKLRIVAKEILVGRIKSFGANPTEGERQYLEQLIPDLQNAEAVNKAILERLQERLGRERAAIQYMFTEGANLDGYVNYVNAIYSADTGPNAQPTGNKRVRFDEIQ